LSVAVVNMTISLMLLVLNGVGTYKHYATSTVNLRMNCASGTNVSVTGRFVLPPKNLVTGVPKAGIVKLSDPVRRTPSEGDYYLKRRLSRGFFMSAIHPLRKHLVRVVLESQDHHRPDPPARPLTDGPEISDDAPGRRLRRNWTTKQKTLL
jgi:hypothetical protein